jgi:large subunit ribosomal protein L22
MEARAIQRTVRQSARKMRLVIDQIRGRGVPEAYAILRFSKKHAAKQIHKVLKSAVANVEQRAQRENVPLDVDALRVRYAVVNEGPALKRFTSAAMGRATPIRKRTSHVEIHVAAPETAKPKPAPAQAPSGAKAKAADQKPAHNKPAEKQRTAGKAKPTARRKGSK